MNTSSKNTVSLGNKIKKRRYNLTNRNRGGYYTIDIDNLSEDFFMVNNS